jgi:hypothetical protein
MPMEKITDLFTIVVGFAALIACGRQYHYERRQHEKATMLIGIITSIMYIALESFWYWHYDIMGDASTGSIENVGWTVANTLALTGFVHMAMKRRHRP